MVATVIGNPAAEATPVLHQVKREMSTLGPVMAVRG